jgi:guanylate kinase
MLLCILGFSASGKDAITEKVINKYSFSKVVQYTSRPKRESETDGVNYHFLEKQSFEKGIVNNDFISFRKFDTTEGEWYYGIKKDSLSSTDNKILIIDIEGLIELKNNIECDYLLSVFIDVDLKLRTERVENRTDVDIREFERRAKADESKKAMILKYCDVVVKNICLNDCLHELYEILDGKTAHHKSTTPNIQG